MDQVLYIVFAAVALVAALLAVTRKSAVAAVCWLVLMFFGLAGIFVLMEAYFVAAVQILVYAGAIMVLFLFVIMLLDLRSAELERHAGPSLKLVGILLAGVFFGAVVFAISDASASPKIADRVSAVLRLPAPPPPPLSDDPTKPPPEAPPAPEPVSVELAEVAIGAGKGERAYVGEFLIDRKAHSLRVVLSPTGGAEAVRIDEVVMEFVKTESGLITLAFDGVLASVGAPAGSTLDVRVQRGGLDASASGGPDGSPRAVGKSLFEVWLLPFEITSLLLTGAIFGAVVLTKRRLK